MHLLGRKGSSGGATTAAQVSNTAAGNLAATNVQAALEELDAEKAGLALANVFTQRQTINLNAGAAPTPANAGCSSMLVGPDSSPSPVRETYSYAGNTARYFEDFYAAAGTLASPSQVQTGTTLFQQRYFARDNAGAYLQAASWTIGTTDNVTTSAKGTRFVFNATPTGSGTSNAGLLVQGGFYTANASDPGQDCAYIFNTLRLGVKTVGTLTAAATAGNGARSHVSDANAPAFGAAVAAGGAVSVPVYSTGAAWNVG